MAEKKKKKETSKYTKWIWKLFAGGLIFALLIFILASLGVFGKLPTFEELENPENNLATEVISLDGKTNRKNFREKLTPIKIRK